MPSLRIFSIHRKLVTLLILALLASLSLCWAQSTSEQQPPARPWPKPRPRFGAQQATRGSAVEVLAPAPVPLVAANSPAAASSAAATTNRTTRTADVFQNGDGYNIFVTNTCERESMKVNIKTSRPFYGVIHTRAQRQKQACSVEGNGEVDYNLEISHILNSQDPNYCGVIKARRDSPEDKDILSVIVAVRLHRNIELSDDKFFLLNCTNRCRKPDCSSPSANLIKPDETDEVGVRERENGANTGNRDGQQQDECTIWKFPWAITLLWCLGILLLAMIISHCIMCSSLICRCVKTEVEEREPSVYEGATDYEDDLYNKRHPYRIEYDNRDIYKTANNYAPYTLEEAQAKSRQKAKRQSR